MPDNKTLATIESNPYQPFTLDELDELMEFVAIAEEEALMEAQFRTMLEERSL